MTYLTTLARVRARLGLRPTDAADDSRILFSIRAASRALERFTGRQFTPTLATRPALPTQPAEIILPGDLLTLTALTDAAGLVPLDTLRLLPVHPPHSVIRRSGGRTFILDPLEPIVTLSGVWGWHDAPAEMWRSTGLLLETPMIGATLPLLTISGALTHPDAEAELPPVSPGTLIAVGAEWLRVTAIADPVTLVVVRGVGGTTAINHPAGEPIRTWQPAADVGAIATEWAARLYADAAPTLTDLHERLRPLRREVIA